MLAEASETVPAFYPEWAQGGNLWKVFAGIMVLIGLMKLLMRRPPKTRAVTLHGRVSCYLGTLGSGKTYTMVRSAKAQLEAGADVYTNFRMHVHHDERCPADCARATVNAAGAWGFVGRIEDVDQLRGEWHYEKGRRVFDRRFVVMVDELESWFAVENGKMSPTHKEVVRNVRKRGGDFLYTSQTLGQVPAMLKGCTNEFFACRTQRTAKGRTFWGTCYTGWADVGKPKKEVFTMKHKFDLAVGDLYDTDEEVTPDEGYGGERLQKMVANRAAGRAPDAGGRRPAPVVDVGAAYWRT